VLNSYFNLTNKCSRIWQALIRFITIFWLFGTSSIRFWATLYLFSFLRHANRSHPWTRPHAQYNIIRCSRQGYDFWGLERLHFNVTFLLQNVTIGSLSWCNGKQYSRRNSGMVTRIHFKLFAWFDHTSRNTWHRPNSKIKESKVKVTKSRNVFN